VDVIPLFVRLAAGGAAAGTAAGTTAGTAARTAAGTAAATALARFALLELLFPCRHLFRRSTQLKPHGEELFRMFERDGGQPLGCALLVVNELDIAAAVAVRASLGLVPVHVHEFQPVFIAQVVVFPPLAQTLEHREVLDDVPASALLGGFRQTERHTVRLRVHAITFQQHVGRVGMEEAQSLIAVW
jgi:hypothetical protein